VTVRLLIGVDLIGQPSGRVNKRNAKRVGVRVRRVRGERRGRAVLAPESAHIPVGPDARRVGQPRGLVMANTLELFEQRKDSLSLILQFVHESSFVVSWERAVTNSQWGADEMLS
jgi:hypothetical protein